jgi:hypothetical protein
MKLYMFRTVPLSTIRSFLYCIHSNGICHTGLLTYTIAMYTVQKKNSW